METEKEKQTRAEVPYEYVILITKRADQTQDLPSGTRSLFSIYFPTCSLRSLQAEIFWKLTPGPRILCQLVVYDFFLTIFMAPIPLVHMYLLSGSSGWMRSRKAQIECG